MMTLQTIVARLQELSRPESVAGMQRFGIRTDTALGIRVPDLRALAKEIRKNHPLALQLWETGIHEGRILATMIDDPRVLTAGQMEDWVKDFESWDVCDQACGNLFSRSPLAWIKATEWVHREEEFVRRAGFVLMATLAVHQKKAPDTDFASFFPLMEQYAFDSRNFVKKAVNWALRQIGKKNPPLRQLAVETAKRIREQATASARWIAADALRELEK